MARDRPFLFSLNGGMVSPLALARVDLQRMKLTAERFENCIPRVIGPMQFRPGLNYNGQTDGEARHLAFIFSVDDTALIELSDLSMRVVIDGTPISRAAVSTTITNGNFSSGTGWTLTVDGSGIATINSTTAGALTLQTPVRGGSALAKRSFTVSAPDQNIEHAIHVVVTRGTVKFRLGSTNGGTEYLGEIELSAGTHSLAFTPTSGTAWVQFSAQSETYVIVDSVQIEGSGIFELTTPWPASEIFEVRYDQSGDVIFAANDGYAPQRLERRGARSWSIVPYQFKDGPWRRKTANVTLTPSVRLGNGTLTASAAFFSALHVGSLFELTHTQTVASVSLAGNDVYTDTLRVAGLSEGTVRNVTYSITGTWTGTITVQISYDEGETWQNRTSYTSNVGTTTINPGTDNTVCFVRIGFQAGDYSSGSAAVALSQPGGGGTGVVRVTAFNSATSVNIEVIKRLHFTGATENWRTSKYDNVWGWPSSVVLYDGRLWFGGSDQLAGSFSDDFTNFDVDEEGDSAPIIRSIASGPVNKVQWMLGLARLIIGTSGGEAVPRSSSFDEPMTASNISIKDASTYGSSDVAAIKIDRSGIFAGRSGKKAYEISYDIEANDYSTVEITRYNPTILNGIVKVMAVQRQPDTRVWFVLEDGTAVVVVRDRGEDVLAWCTFITDGDIEDVAVIPNTEADDVYMIVNRTINGSPVRYRERLAYDTEAEGGIENYMADSFVAQSLVATATVPGLSHLEGETDIVAWVDGEPLLGAEDSAGIKAPLTFTVAGAAITLPSAVTARVIVGKYYEGFWKSTKLAYAAQTGTAMSQKKIVDSAAPILYNTHAWATLWGQDFTNMLPVPAIVRGEDISDTILETYDYDAFALPGKWDNDSRLCMKARAPMPATVLGVGLGIQSHER